MMTTQHAPRSRGRSDPGPPKRTTPTRKKPTVVRSYAALKKAVQPGAPGAHPRITDALAFVIAHHAKKGKPVTRTEARAIISQRLAEGKRVGGYRPGKVMGVTEKALRKPRTKYSVPT